MDRTALPRTAAATEAFKDATAVRALDDPVKLARAARIVRHALARQRLTLDDLVYPPAPAKDGGRR